MRIVVNDIAASTSGALEILTQFYQYIRDTDKINEWIFLLGSGYLEETDNIKVYLYSDVKKSPLKKIAFDFIYGKKEIDKYKPDVVISLQNIITFGVSVPQYVYVHQSIPYQTIKRFSFIKREERPYAIYQYIIGKIIDLSIKKSEGVIVQTQWMKNAVVNKLNIYDKTIIVAMPNCSHHNMSENSCFENTRFFCPTSDCIYKNNELIVKACDLLNKKGINDFKVVMTLEPGTIIHKNIECIGYLNREQLNIEYGKANLLFPSYIETVGLPLLEAADYGVPILASACPHSMEVLRNYKNVLFFDPFKEDELAEDMEKCIENKFIRSDLNVSNQNINNKNGWNSVIKVLLRSN